VIRADYAEQLEGEVDHPKAWPHLLDQAADVNHLIQNRP
jgi:hypothetical protein